MKTVQQLNSIFHNCSCLLRFISLQDCLECIFILEHAFPSGTMNHSILEYVFVMVFTVTSKYTNVGLARKQLQLAVLKSTISQILLLLVTWSCRLCLQADLHGIHSSWLILHAIHSPVRPHMDPEFSSSDRLNPAKTNSVGWCQIPLLYRNSAIINTA